MTYCADEIVGATENQSKLATELKNLNNAFAPFNKTEEGKSDLPQLDGNTIFNPSIKNAREDYLKILDGVFKNAKIDSKSFEILMTNTTDQNLKECKKMSAVFLSNEKLDSFIVDKNDVATVRKCQKGIASLNLDKRDKELQEKIAENSLKVQNIINDPRFKNLEIMKSLLYTDFYKKCTNEDKVENIAAMGTCSNGFLNNHTKQVDVLKQDYNNINDEIITRNYLNYLNINDRGSLFKSPEQWAKILKTECQGYKKASETLDSSKAKCGFESSCHACQTVYNLGNSAIATRRSEELSNLPMYVYREYDPKSGTMINKHHPIKSMVAHTMMYAARRIPQFGAPLIQWQQFKGQALQMQYSALYNKQMYTWNKQYRQQAYQAYDLTNPNLFSPYSNVKPGYSF